MFTLAQWIARLTKGYIRHTGKKPDGLAKLKIKMDAAQKVKDQSKVIKGDFNPKEEWWKARPEKTVPEVSGIDTLLKSDFESMTKPKVKKDLPKSKINYVEMEKKFGFPLRGTESFDELVKIEKMGRDQYYNSLADRAMSIRTRMSRLDQTGGTEIGYQEFNKLQKEMDEIGEFIERVQKEIPEDMASGGIARVGFAGGLLARLYKGVKGLQHGAIERKLRKKYGKGFESYEKASNEATEIVNQKKLKIVENKMNEVNIGSDDYVDLIDESIRLTDREMYKDIKRWKNTRPDLADKTRALHFPDWAAARYGEDYQGALNKRQASALKQKSDEIDKMYPDTDGGIQGLVDEIDDMNKANIDEIIGGRKKNATGGLARVGMFGGGLLRKFLLNKKTVRKAVDDIFPTGDYKYDAEMAAEALVENNPKFFKNKLYDDLSDADRMEVYGSVLSEVQNDLAKMLETRRLSKPTKTLEGLKKEGTIDISNPEVADEFSRFMKESDPKGYKDLEQKVDLSNLDIKGKKGHASGGIAGQLHLNEGGRVPMIFGGSAGLKAMIASIKAGLNKGRTEKIKTLFPKYSVEDKEILRLGEKYLPQDSATMAAKEIEAKAEGIDVLINRLKHDKKLIAEQAKNKAKKDPSLDFLMESLEKTMPEAYGPHLKKYTNIDKDILQLETIKKNLIMKDRKLNAEGGIAGQLHMNRPGYATGEEVYGPSLPEKKKKKKKKEEEEKMRPPETYADPFWQYGLRFPTEEKPGTRVDPTEGIGFDSFGDIDVDLTDPRFKLGIYDPEENYYPWDFEIGKGDIGFKWKKKFGGPKKLNKGGRVSLSKGGLASILGV